MTSVLHDSLQLKNTVENRYHFAACENFCAGETRFVLSKSQIQWKMNIIKMNKIHLNCWRMVNNQITYNKQENIPWFNNFKHYRNDTKIFWGAVCFCLGFLRNKGNKIRGKKGFMVKIWSRITASWGKYTRIYLTMFDAWSNVWTKESWGHWDPC